MSTTMTDPKDVVRHDVMGPLHKLAEGEGWLMVKREPLNMTRPFVLPVTDWWDLPKTAVPIAQITVPLATVNRGVVMVPRRDFRVEVPAGRRQ